MLDAWVRHAISRLLCIGQATAALALIQPWHAFPPTHETGIGLRAKKQIAHQAKR
jgi:hypothetical protein